MDETTKLFESGAKNVYTDTYIIAFIRSQR